MAEEIHSASYNDQGGNIQRSSGNNSLKKQQRYYYIYSFNSLLILWLCAAILSMAANNCHWQINAQTYDSHTSELAWHTEEESKLIFLFVIHIFLFIYYMYMYINVKFISYDSILSARAYMTQGHLSRPAFSRKIGRLCVRPRQGLAGNVISWFFFKNYIVV